MYGKPTPKYAKTIGLVSLPRQLTYMYTIIKIYLIFSIYLYKSFVFFFGGGVGGRKEGIFCYPKICGNEWFPLWRADLFPDGWQKPTSSYIDFP